MRYFLDTEFIEKRDSIDLISIGIVGEDGSALHLLSSDYDGADASDWVVKNVLTPMYKALVTDDAESDYTILNFNKAIGMPRDEIATELKKFIKVDDSLEFWAYYGDYDWVVFCWIFGTMIELPKGYPIFCMDLKQSLVESGKDKIPDPVDEHNALADAKWNRDLYKHIYG